LLSHNFEISFFLIATKLLTTQVYFDLYLKNNSYQSYLFNYFDSFEKWLQREKFRSNFTKRGYLRFVQKCRALAKFYSSVDLKKEKVNQIFDSEDNIQALTWLKKKKKEILILKSRGRSS